MRRIGTNYRQAAKIRQVRRGDPLSRVALNCPRDRQCYQSLGYELLPRITCGLGSLEVLANLGGVAVN